MTARRSGAKAGDVDRYLARVPPKHRAVLEELRRTIKSAAPGATEVITYQMPGFRAHGRSLVSYAAFSDHYSLFPMGTTAVTTHAGLVRPYLSGKSTIRFDYDEPLPVAVVRTIVKARLTENASRARPAPTRRSRTPAGASR